MKKVKAAAGRLFRFKRKSGGVGILKRRRVFVSTSELGADVQNLMEPVQIDPKQRARMAVRYPHLYTAPADDLLEAIAEDRAREDSGAAMAH